MERIDVHVHCVPPAYREYCLQNDFAGKGHPDGMPAIPEWDPETHIDLMKRLNITKSILSISSPGTHLTPGNDEEARSLTRRVNVDMSKICADNPDHFLFFASLPLPDTEGSLSEIDYALDHLGAVGFQILTNSHGIYPGDPRFSKVFDRLSELKAIVFCHPTSCNIHNRQDGSVTRATPQFGVPSPMMEFMFDSTRSLMSLLTSGTVKRCPGITFLACHCGGTFPPVMERIAQFSQVLLSPELRVTGDEVKEMLQTRFYFDLAGLPFPDQIHGLLRLVDSSRLLYGSDYPYTPVPAVLAFAKKMDDGFTSEFLPEVKENVYLKNAQEFLARAPHH
ncbi:hypothetical protein N7474_009007 [Penicillium riverlandense]|uniref:uncharacterized protein n=1 Tax=Penicillium riverlandense TaxID=1903569 RepID=UPI002547499E|nr:uncharacterized protein N7474_009007 [Penicillium riverlandense]KAJ5807738.1 hypothetical protein N7474_009007 [Penicillium riverlandense]